MTVKIFIIIATVIEFIALLLFLYYLNHDKRDKTISGMKAVKQTVNQLDEIVDKLKAENIFDDNVKQAIKLVFEQLVEKQVKVSDWNTISEFKNWINETKELYLEVRKNVK